MRRCLNKLNAFQALLPSIPLLIPGIGQTGEWSGNVGVEMQTFNKEALSNEQHDNYMSVYAQPEYFREWDRGSRSFTAEAYMIGSQYDSRRSHVDLREFNVGIIEEEWEATVGISKVFWGIAESNHLVDIINQTDLVENIDTEDKLGQPMLNVTLIRGAGNLDLFVLPYFRERVYPGNAGRPRFPLKIDQDNEVYESGNKQKHVDVAARWYQWIGDWEVAISHFKGTSRIPDLVVTPTGVSSPPVLIPHYNQINQTGLEIQGTFDAWLWKFEAIRNNGFQGDSKSYKAAVGGFEYTFVLESGVEVGALMEYNWDSRGREAFTQFQNDTMVGTRITLNDVQSTEILAAVIIDMGGASRSYNVEAERRIGDSWKASLEARGVFHASEEDLFYGFRRDNSLRFNLAKYF